ncbi:hypothetical protein K1W69_18465 [Hoeflea sp. WL0058]|uniref:Strictosidine synthase conserved region domain-containing protein n=1 Tax=Flavimaribacter sediminis TaxID=2865987 RepID=A0AAE3D2T9_9HYPH|nr:hypothetical protein [Flavimaribacter sediminis]MBW8639186.1 hypothetical protein [Flavimaribacter sediminis]
MIGAIMNAIDNFFGRGESAVTVPPLDGALKPNRILDDTDKRYPLEDVDCLAESGRKLFATSGRTVCVLGPKDRWTSLCKVDADITCIAPIGKEGLGIALASGDIVVHGGAEDGKRFRAAPDVNCITAMIEKDGVLYLANGSASNASEDWQRDLLQRNASGSIWRIGLSNGRSELLTDGLAWPAGIAIDEKGLVVSESWKHRLIRLDPFEPKHTETLYHDLPAYPGRLSASPKGWWLAAFAPRSQLVEFVLREPGYCARMLEDIPKDYWVSPKLQSGRSFYEPLQGGGVKHLGQLKPWAPTMSAGLCVELDGNFQPVSGLHSRADGVTHGITSVVELNGTVYAASRGHGVVVRVPVEPAGSRS